MNAESKPGREGPSRPTSPEGRQAPPPLDFGDPPTTRTRALQSSMRRHEQRLKGYRRAMVVVLGVTIACAIGFVALLLLQPVH